ncbi:MAG: arylsulfatase [Pirellulales bacterium]|nr:arylsulfatase [Pirellulales bacterium]
MLAPQLRDSTCALLVVICMAVAARVGIAAERPNVLLIITDDQGYGDLGVHGNPAVRTPHLDRLAGQGAQFKTFYVSPVCSPTRASLLTGRYNYRTGVVDTYLGRSMMHPDEVTLAEMLASAGYRTGIFGKWHLGDNYPLRPQDQGFQETLVHRGGGIAQPAGPPGDGYFDPVLVENGQPVQKQGYCSDIYTDAAIDFVARHRGEPWFAYLAFNCPHTPLQVEERYVEPYRNVDFGTLDYGRTAGQPLPSKIDRDTTARVYGMVNNIDENVGRLLARLDELELAQDTIVIFLTDNGPQQPRYNAGMLDLKGNVHEGGIRVPCFVRWPRRIEPGRQVEPIAAHLDLVPTILDACEVEVAATPKLDGKSLLPLLTGAASEWPDRTLFFQWHRGEVPQPHRACAVRTQRYKLAQPLGARDDDRRYEDAPFELYDLSVDPYEQKNIVAEHPDLVADLTARYDAWYADVRAEREFAPPRIVLGTEHENPATLTRQDWRGPDSTWGEKGRGHWLVDVATPGTFDVTLRFPAVREDSTASFSLGDVTRTADLVQGATEHTFREVRLPAGQGQLEAVLSSNAQEEGIGAHYVDVQRLP